MVPGEIQMVGRGKNHYRENICMVGVVMGGPWDMGEGDDLIEVKDVCNSMETGPFRTTLAHRKTISPPIEAKPIGNHISLLCQARA